jgi:hypothetical protein
LPCSPHRRLRSLPEVEPEVVVLLPGVVEAPQVEAGPPEVEAAALLPEAVAACR